MKVSLWTGFIVFLIIVLFANFGWLGSGALRVFPFPELFWFGVFFLGLFFGLIVYWLRKK